MQLLVQRVEMVGAFALRVNFFLLGGVLIVFTFLKVGLVDMSISPDEVQTNNEAFPNPVGALTGTSYGLRLVHWTINPQNRGEIFLVSFISLVLALLLIQLAIRTIPGKFERILVTVAVFLGPIAVVLLGNVGRNDIFLLVGSVLVAVQVPVNPPRPNGDQNPTRRIIYFVGGGGAHVFGQPGTNGVRNVHLFTDHANSNTTTSL